MGEKNDRILKGVQIVPEGRFQGIDITLMPPPNPGVLDISLREEVRPGPLDPHRQKTKDKKTLPLPLPRFRYLSRKDTLPKIKR